MGGVRLPRRCSGPLRAAVLLRTPPFRGAVAAAVRQQQQRRQRRRRQQQHPVRGRAGGAVARGGAAGPAQRGQGAPSRTVTPSPAVPALRGARCPQSTLLNALVGQKVSIATSKAQTTRRETLGVLTTGNVQLVPRRAHTRPQPPTPSALVARQAFFDTPGILHPTKMRRRCAQTHPARGAALADPWPHPAAA